MRVFLLVTYWDDLRPAREIDHVAVVVLDFPFTVCALTFSRCTYVNYEISRITRADYFPVSTGLHMAPS